MTVTKATISEVLNKDLGIPVKDSINYVDEILEIVKSTIEKGESVKISGFGTFSIIEKGKRIGRNPKTREEIEIPPRKVVTYHVSQVLKKELNK